MSGVCFPSLLDVQTDARCVYPSSVLQDGRWEDPACHFSHVIFNLYPKLLDVWVQIEVGILHLGGMQQN